MSHDFTVDLSGKTAVVTGATRGIGRSITDLLIDSGAEVIGLQRSVTGGRSRSFTAVPVDLSDPLAVDDVAAQIAADHTIDILVNNAGINIRHKFENFPMSDFDEVMRTNLRTVVALTQVFGRQMLDRGNGRIVNLASMLSYFGGFTAAAYAASKGAVGQFTKSIANEWAPRGVNVNAVAPGFIGTDMTVALQEDTSRNREILERIPAGRWGEPADIAGAVLFLVSSAANYIHGAVVPVDGGYLSR